MTDTCRATIVRCPACGTEYRKPVVPVDFLNEARRGIDRLCEALKEILIYAEANYDAEVETYGKCISDWDVVRAEAREALGTAPVLERPDSAELSTPDNTRGPA